MQNRRSSCENGFTITELLAAIMLLSLGVIFAVSMFDMSMTTASRSKTRTYANLLASEKIESVRSISYDQIAVTYLQQVLGTTATRGNAHYTLAYAVTYVNDPGDDPESPGVDADPNDYKKVAVTVSWTSPKPAGQVVLETMINKNPVPPASQSGDTTPPTWPTSSPLSGSAQETPTLCNYLQWSPNWATDNQGVVGYLIYRQEATSGYLLISTVAPSVGYFQDIYYTPGLVYHYYLKAFDAAGLVSVASNAVMMTGLADTVAPSIPTSLVAVPISSTQVKLTWTDSTDNAGVDHYNVFRTKSGSGWQSNPIGIATSPIYYDTTVASATTYLYRLTAVDAAGNESGLSDQISVTPP